MSSTDLGAAFEAQRSAFRSEPYATLATRRARIETIIRVLVESRDALADVVRDDFGHHSRHECLLTEVYLPVQTARYVLKNLQQWMRVESRPVSLALRPGRAEVIPQPLGVVGIISPWNYPIQLAVVPLIYALAAGNRVSIKPSELTPRTSERLAALLGRAFPPDLVHVLPGGSDVAAAFAELPFDHLFYTGSTRVGRLVMQAAAKNLTPVTLELGGKSPAIVHEAFPVERAAGSLAAGKLFNAGQTCVAPDYVLVHRDRADAFCDALARQITRLYPRMVDNPDYTCVVNEHHRARLAELLVDAAGKGARLRQINPANEAFEGSGKVAPVIVRGVNPEMALMTDEIFGPILPIVEVGSLDEAIHYVNARPRPLALYYFDQDSRRVEEVLLRTHSGGVTVNDCMLQVAEEHLPFGGIGPSGMGSYHGKEGFDTFSHRKGVFHQPRINGRFLARPPYGKTVERLLDLLL